MKQLSIFLLLFFSTLSLQAQRLEHERVISPTVPVEVLIVNQWGGDGIGAGIVVTDLETEATEFYPVHQVTTRLVRGRAYRIAPCNHLTGVCNYTRSTWTDTATNPAQIVLMVHQVHY